MFRPARTNIDADLVGSKNTDARKTVWQSGVSERIESRYRPNVVEAIGPQASQSVSVSTERAPSPQNDPDAVPFSRHSDMTAVLDRYMRPFLTSC